jgi:hypothetical protein
MEKIEKLTAAVTRLAERVEDLEDLRDLEQAIAENGDKPLVPWGQVKAELELDWHAAVWVRRHSAFCPRSQVALGNALAEAIPLPISARNGISRD